MARKKAAPEEKAGGGESGSGRWMLTYLDMITLLFGVFVLLYAMSVVDAKKFDEVAEALRQGFQGGSRSIFNYKKIGGQTILEKLNPAGVRIKMPFQKLYDQLRSEIESNFINVHQDERGIVISMAADIYFDSGSAKLKEEAKPPLLKVIPILKEMNRNVRIEGYTDDIAIVENDFTNDRNYEDNWELGAMRAINVLRFIEAGGVDKNRISAQTFGETKPLINYKRFPDVGTPEARAFNRRVDIVIMTDPNKETK